MIKKILKDKNFLFYVILFYLFVTIIFNYNLFKVFNTGLPGLSQLNDAPALAWNFWWVKKQLLSLHSPYYTNFIYYPQTVSLAYYTLTPFFGIISIPFQSFLSLPTIYNSLYLSSFVLSGLGTYILINYLTQNKIASIVAGLIFVFSPNIFGHAYGGHLNLITVWVIPLFIYNFLRLYETKKGKYLIFSAILLIAQTYIDLVYLFFILIFVFLFIIWKIINDRRNLFNRKNIANLIFMFLLWLIFSMPYLYVWFKARSEGDYVFTKTYENTDLLNYFRPSALHPVFGKWQKEIINKTDGKERENSVYLGYSALILSFLALLKVKKKEKWFWLGIFFIFFILSLGLKLQINLKNYISLPYIYLEKLPVFSSGLVPARFILMSELSLSILTGLYLAHYLNIKKTKKLIPSFVIALIICAIIFEFYPGKLEVDKLEISNFYYTIKNEKEDFSIIELPYSSANYFQTIHNKKVLKGQLGRRLNEKYSLEYDKPGLRILYNPDYKQQEDDLDREKVLSILNEYNVKYIILNKQKLTFYEKDILTNYITNVLFLDKIYEDDQILTYENKK